MVSVFMGQNMRMERQCVSIDHSITFLLGWINLEILILVFERIDPHIKIAAGSIFLNIHGIIYINYFIVYLASKLCVILDWAYFMLIMAS